MSIFRIGKLFVILAALIANSGCSPFVKDGQPAVFDQQVVLENGHSVGQTFVARDGGLEGLEVFLKPDTRATGEIRFHLRDSVQASSDLAISSLEAQSVTAPGNYRFAFPPQVDSYKRNYYALFEFNGYGRVNIGSAPGNAFLDGALYQDGDPRDAQMTFRLIYDSNGLLFGLIRQVAEWLRALLIAIFLFVLPGWALVEIFLSNADSFSWGEKLGLAAALSLAIYPLAILWTHLVQLHLGSLYAWASGFAALGFLIWRHGKWKPINWQAALRDWRHSENWLPDVTYLLVLAMVFGVRFWVIRSLDAPMWGDSYQHTLIAQLIVDKGGLFDSWMPYVPYNTLTVQFGFPATVAILSWATEMESTLSTLLMGQLLNGLAVLVLYPLAVRLAEGNRWAGVGAVLIAGLLSHMPAFYVNWGRYAQLAGQAILPVALWFVWEAVENKYRNWRTIALAGGVLAGMTLTYYRMPFYYSTFILSWMMGWGLPRWKLDIRRWSSSVAILVTVGGVALFFLLPWGIHVSQGNLANAVESGVKAATPLETVLADYQSWYGLTFYVPPALLMVALAGLVWGLIQRRWVIASLGLWIIGLASLVAGRLIHLPGANLMQNFAVLIALYIPVGLLGGWFIGQIAQLAEKQSLFKGQIIITVTALCVAFWGALIQSNVQKPQTFAIVSPPDLTAMAWIRKNIPSDALFLVEGFRIYNGRSAVGADAGWWIPLLAKRANTMPPQYALVNEAPIEWDYTQHVTDLVADLEKKSPTSAEGMKLLCSWGVTHVYIGQGQGKVGAGAVQLFPPEVFVSTNAFNLVYRQDRVYIFALNRQECEGK